MVNGENFINLLPDDVIFTTLVYLAGPTDRVSILCHQLESLSKGVCATIRNEREELWRSILRIDYKVESQPINLGSSSRSEDRREGKRQRRISTRSRRTAREEVRDAHIALCYRTEAAQCVLSEASHSHLVCIRGDDVPFS